MKVECVLQNKFGKFFVTSEGWHINGDRQKFIKSVKKQFKSPYHNKQIEAELVMDYINNEIEI